MKTQRAEGTKTESSSEVAEEPMLNDSALLMIAKVRTERRQRAMEQSKKPGHHSRQRVVTSLSAMVRRLLGKS